jgi:hypothetical protein
VIKVHLNISKWGGKCNSVVQHKVPCINSWACSHPQHHHQNNKYKGIEKTSKRIKRKRSQVILIKSVNMVREKNRIDPDVLGWHWTY